jgi:hypothetical protein
MSWTGTLADIVRAFNVFVLVYFIALNVSYFLLFLVSLREVWRFRPAHVLLGLRPDHAVGP